MIDHNTNLTSRMFSNDSQHGYTHVHNCYKYFFCKIQVKNLRQNSLDFGFLLAEDYNTFQIDLIVKTTWIQHKKYIKMFKRAFFGHYKKAESS